MAALEYIAEQWPALAVSGEDYPSVVEATAEHAKGVAALLHGEAKGTTR